MLARARLSLPQSLACEWEPWSPQCKRSLASFLIILKLLPAGLTLGSASELRPEGGCSLPGASALLFAPTVPEKVSNLQEYEDHKKRKYLRALASFQEELEQIGVVRPCSCLLCCCSIPWVGRCVPTVPSLLSPLSVLSVSPQQMDGITAGRVQGT